MANTNVKITMRLNTLQELEEILRWIRDIKGENPNTEFCIEVHQ